MFYLGCKVKYTFFISDIDKCKEGQDIEMNECHPNASCINSQGSYHCSCNSIYVENGFECKGMFSFLLTFQLVKAALELTCCFSGGHCRPIIVNSRHAAALVIPPTLGMVLNAKVHLVSYKSFNLSKQYWITLTCCFSGGHCRQTPIPILLN